jgi:hypothetical protein
MRAALVVSKNEDRRSGLIRLVLPDPASLREVAPNIPKLADARVLHLASRRIRVQRLTREMC